MGASTTEFYRARGKGTGGRLPWRMTWRFSRSMLTTKGGEGRTNDVSDSIPLNFTSPLEKTGT